MTWRRDGGQPVTRRGSLLKWPMMSPTVPERQSTRLRSRRMNCGASLGWRCFFSIMIEKKQRHPKEAPQFILRDRNRVLCRSGTVGDIIGHFNKLPRLVTG